MEFSFNGLKGSAQKLFSKTNIDRAKDIAIKEVTSAGRNLTDDTKKYVAEVLKNPREHKQGIAVIAISLLTLAYKIDTFREGGTATEPEIAGMTEIKQGDYCYDSFGKHRYPLSLGVTDKNDPRYVTTFAGPGDTPGEDTCTWVDTNTGRSVETSTVNGQTFGTWTDDKGNSGTFTYVGEQQKESTQ